MNKTVFTISGRTCSGKTYILNKLLETGKFSKLVTSTTRGKRENEADSDDYYFIQSGFAEHLINTNKFVEYNVYGGQVYGLTRYELAEKLAYDEIPCVILTPNGVTAYKEILAKEGINVKSIFIDCCQELVVDRLTTRTLAESDLNFDVISTVIYRAMSVAINERDWKDQVDWDLYVNADDDRVFETIQNFIESNVSKS